MFFHQSAFGLATGSLERVHGAFTNSPAMFAPSSLDGLGRVGASSRKCLRASLASRSAHMRQSPLISLVTDDALLVCVR